MNVFNKILFNIISVSLLCALAFPVAAQGVLEEILVTAQKRDFYALPAPSPVTSPSQERWRSAIP